MRLYPFPFQCSAPVFHEKSRTVVACSVLSAERCIRCSHCNCKSHLAPGHDYCLKCETTAELNARLDAAAKRQELEETVRRIVDRNYARFERRLLEM